MPTGYTADVADGKITELEPFVLQLARGMGALVTMREEPYDAPIPERFEPSAYQAEELAKAKAELARLSSLSLEEAKAEAEAEAAEYDLRVAEARKKNWQVRDRYNDMLAKVREWTGAPEGIKEFAIQQLTTARDFDAPSPFKYWSERPDTDAETWLRNKLTKAMKDVQYHTDEVAKDAMRTEERNSWLARLRASLRG